MKKIMAFFAAIALTASGAMAGGYVAPVSERPVEKPAAVEAVNWTGFSAGGSVGKTGTKLSFDGVDEFGDSLHAKIDDDATNYGVFAGYRHQYTNGVVAGAEVNYAKTEKFFDLDGTETYGAEAQVGYAFDRVLPYVAVGYGKAWGETAVSWSVGTDFAVNDKIIAGIKYTRTDLGDFDIGESKFNADVDTVALRVGYRF